ncbi:MAG TPA: MarR family transcriptional regulator [Gammaproteobacteria bacterium]|nr:MarR family transcriptional regulator [Gammaproteobacteria bacterium]
MAEADRERFGTMVGELSRMWRRTLNHRLKPLGLSQAQWMVILHLGRARGAMVQHELAERLNIEAPSLARLLDRMAASDWVERRESPTDRRCKMVHLTRKSRAAARKIDAAIREVRQELLADVTPDDLAHFERIFRLISSRAEALQTVQQS